MFIPYTPNGELAKILRDNENKLEELTGTRLKLVERTGSKLVDLITRSNPWQGLDCQRENCLLCFTKSETEKLKTQECTKRNIVYETRCRTCEDNEKTRIEELELDEKSKNEELKNLKIFKYVGETSRSAFERGWEHLNDMATLNKKSHMLKHVIMNHPGEDMANVKFGMKFLKFCQTSFERQVLKAVTIRKERKHHHLLNSRTEYNRCSLPRLSTQTYKEYNRELEDEQKSENYVEMKIRELRKQRNKARKIDENNQYIKIEEIWGKPTIAAPVKNKPEIEIGPEETEKSRKKRKIEEKKKLTWLKKKNNQIITENQNIEAGFSNIDQPPTPSPNTTSSPKPIPTPPTLPEKITNTPLSPLPPSPKEEDQKVDGDRKQTEEEEVKLEKVGVSNNNKNSDIEDKIRLEKVNHPETNTETQKEEEKLSWELLELCKEYLTENSVD